MSHKVGFRMLVSTFAFSQFLTLVASPANAALHDRGGGLIYDDVLDVTWLQDVAYAGSVNYRAASSNGRMTWDEALVWVASLGYYDTVRGQMLTGWRLPTISPLNGEDFTYQTASTQTGGGDYGWNVSAPGTPYAGSTASELAFMYYNTLGNTTNGFVNKGPFINFEPGYLWTGNGYVPLSMTNYCISYSHCGWMFSTLDNGYQQWVDWRALGNAWAVRDGDVAPVPEPQAYALMLAGLGFVGYVARRRRGHPQSPTIEASAA